MPAINAVKRYVEGGIYHVYNRGVNRQNIFLAERDYFTFLKSFQRYLEPPAEDDLYRLIKSYHGKINLLTFSLIPNHFHTMLQQVDRCDMEGFMRSLMTSYARRINKGYERVGHLFQGPYKARLLKGNDDLVNTSFYIHNNPEDELGANPFTYPYSSIGSYDGSGRGFVFVKERPILDLFESAEDYINGLKDYKKVPTRSGLDLP